MGWKSEKTTQFSNDHWNTSDRGSGILYEFLAFAWNLKSTVPLAIRGNKDETNRQWRDSSLRRATEFVFSVTPYIGPGGWDTGARETNDFVPDKSHPHRVRPQAAGVIAIELKPTRPWTFLLCFLAVPRLEPSCFYQSSDNRQI